LLERLILSAFVGLALWRLLEPRSRAAPQAGLCAALSIIAAWAALGFSLSGAAAADAFPEPLGRAAAAALAAATVGASIAAFAAAQRSAREGAAFGLAATAVGFCAARWPALSRALEFNGAIFVGPFLANIFPFAYAATLVLLAAALLWEEVRPQRVGIVGVLILVWAGATAATELTLAKRWGFGPRTLSSAAAVPTDDAAQTMAVVRLTSRRGRSTTRETVRLASRGIDLSPESLGKLEAFLERTGSRDVFAREATTLVRKGWLLSWDVERALDAMTLSVPGINFPDYRGALDLIKVGPMTADRYARLERLAARAHETSEGFEDVTKSQYIFEGFAAAYARFGDEAKARLWLARVDNLMMVSDKKIEVAPLEDFREGRVSGTVLLDGRPAGSVLVGLFSVWRTTSSVPAALLLSGSTYPDEDGRYEFTNLGPGEYELALLGRPQDLRGRITGSPGRFTLGFERPRFLAPAVLIERDLIGASQTFSPSRLPPAPVPEIAEPPLLWRKR
jgi:hypothetical protein